MEKTVQQSLAALKAGKLDGTTRLTLRENLTAFPEEIFQLADTLEILDLSGNHLDCLPDDLFRLHKLRILFCSNNQFSQLPECLGLCPKLSMIGFKANKIKTVASAALPTNTLRWLILTDNQIATLPDNLGNCLQMQKLMLAGNRLSKLPSSLARCTNLELLRISANQLAELPQYLFSLPRLSWLAYAGNPFSESDESALASKQNAPLVAWNSLKIKQKLGEGASGTIHEAEWLQPDGQYETVAVKLFKSAFTSDGLPRCEANATAFAGLHPSLPRLIGRLTDHPELMDGLVLGLLPESLKVLARPPSFESCSRDIYSTEIRFSPYQVLQTARDIASAVHHLHQRGITHGDLYAHNILADQSGAAILTDFGGASFLPTHDIYLSTRLQQIECLAFSHLLEELLQRCDFRLKDHDAIDHLWALQQSCSKPELEQRPLFEVIVSRLAAISIHN